jgi:hypothetical protein
MNRRGSQLLRIAALVLVAALGFSVARTATNNRTQEAGFEPAAPNERFQHFANADSGYVLVYVTSSTCAAAADPQLPDLLATTITELRKEMRAHEALLSVGVALDSDIGRGTIELQRYRGFDQVAVGGGSNSIALDWMSPLGSGGIVATPSLMLVPWHRNPDNTTLSLGEIQIKLIGVHEIRRWAERARIPSIRSAISDTALARAAGPLRQ